MAANAPASMPGLQPQAPLGPPPAPRIQMLLRTTETKGHFHVVTLNEDGSGITSSDKNHRHEIVANPTEGAQMPGGPTETQPLPFVVEADGHTHELIDLPDVLSSEPPSLIDAESPMPDDPWSFNSDAEARELVEAIRDYRDIAKREKHIKKETQECRDFREGDQWTSDQITKLDSEGRAHLVINYSGSLVDLFSGYARQNRRDPKAYPVREACGKVADVLNMTMKQVSVDSDCDQHNIRVFDDGVISGRGCWRLSMDYEDDILGRIRIRRVDDAKVHFGPHKEMDASDSEIVAIEEWYSKQRLKQMYPEKAAAMDKVGSAALLKDVDLETMLSQPSILDWGAEIIKTIRDPDFSNRTTKTWKLIELERKEFRNAVFVVTEDGSIVQEVKSNLRKKFETVKGVRVLVQPRYRIRKTVFTGQVLLEDFYPDLPFKGFSVVPYYAYLNDKGEYYGKLRAAMDPQKEVNKRHSQVADIVNSCAGYGRWFDNDTFDDPNEETEFRKHGGKPGYIGKLRDVMRPPAKEEGTKVPAEVLKFEEVSIDQFYRATNVNPQLFGMMESANESGKMAMIRQRSAMIGNEFLFDNYMLALRRLWKNVVAMIKAFYSPERIVRLAVANSNMTKQPMAIGGEDQDVEDPAVLQAIIDMMSKSDLLDYDITIADGPASPTTMEAERMQWTEFSQYNPGVVPPEMIAALSSLPQKDKWAKVMAARSQAQFEATQAKAKVDIVKSGRGITEAEATVRSPSAPGGAAKPGPQ